jgi:hypothetical protein
MSALPPISYDVHGISYGSVCMTHVQYMVQISGIAIIVSDRLNMFLYKKKQSLNIQLYHIHIHNANIWQQTWNIDLSINQKLLV